MIQRMIMVVSLLGATLATPAMAQPADLPIPAASTTEFPDGITVSGTGAEAVYVDAEGRTLYGLDMRTVHRWSPDPAVHCAQHCAAEWVPLLADDTPNIAFPESLGDRLRRAVANGQQPAGRGEIPDSETLPDGSIFYNDPQKAPDWTVIAGAQGPQWVYKGWHLVFTRADETAGARGFDGAENFTWNTLKFIPPAPEVVAPPQVAVNFTGEQYTLTDLRGHLLFTGRCANSCESWKPLAAGMANRGVADWSVDRSGETPRWVWRGQPVFVADASEPEALPPGARALTIETGGGQ